MYSRSPGTAVIHTTLASPSVCTHDEAVSVWHPQYLFVEYADHIGSCLKWVAARNLCRISLSTFEGDASEGDRAEVILHFWGRFLWYRDDYSCLPKKRNVASVQRLLKKPHEDWCQDYLRTAPVIWSRFVPNMSSNIRGHYKSKNEIGPDH